MNAFHTVVPGPAGADDSAFAMALLFGCGMNVRATRHISVRTVEASWLRTQLPNTITNDQNSLRLGSGIVVRFK